MKKIKRTIEFIVLMKDLMIYVIGKVFESFFNFIMTVSMLISIYLLVHDFIFWGVVPMFSGVTYQLTYLGMFLDVVAIGLIDLSIQFIKEWF